MELTYTDYDDLVRKISLKGRLDVEGATAIDLRFTSLACSQQRLVIVDLTEVDFIASLGIATLVRNAKAARLRAGNLVLLSPQENVARVLTAMKIDQLLTVCPDMENALLRVREIPPAVT